MLKTRKILAVSAFFLLAFLWGGLAVAAEVPADPGAGAAALPGLEAEVDAGQAVPVPAAETAKAEPGDEIVLMSSPIEDCQLQCHQAFTACRQAAGGSGGPGFPAAAFEECADELDRCLAEECGIGC